MYDPQNANDVRHPLHPLNTGGGSGGGGSDGAGVLAYLFAIAVVLVVAVVVITIAFSLLVDFWHYWAIPVAVISGLYCLALAINREIFDQPIGFSIALLLVTAFIFIEVGNQTGNIQILQTGTGMFRGRNLNEEWPDGLPTVADSWPDKFDSAQQDFWFETSEGLWSQDEFEILKDMDSDSDAVVLTRINRARVLFEYTEEDGSVSKVVHGGVTGSNDHLRVVTNSIYEVPHDDCSKGWKSSNGNHCYENDQSWVIGQYVQFDPDPMVIEVEKREKGQIVKVDIQISCNGDLSRDDWVKWDEGLVADYYKDNGCSDSGVNPRTLIAFARGR